MKNYKKQTVKKPILGLITFGLLSSLFMNIYYFNFGLTPAQIEEDTAQMIKNAQEQLAKSNPTQVYNPTEIKDLGVKQELTKQSAVETLTLIFNEYGKDKSGKDLSAKERFDRIVENENEFTNLITDTALNKLYLKDITKNQETQISTSLVMLSFYSSLTSNKESKEIQPVLSNLELVYLDENTKTAHIPIDMFTGTPGAMSFTMAFDNNEWKLAPYSLLQSVQLSDFVQQAVQSTTTTSSSEGS